MSLKSTVCLSPKYKSELIFLKHKQKIKYQNILILQDLLYFFFTEHSNSTHPYKHI